MAMFFFVSGYFTPSSCDKRGVESFMKEKLKRLGIPFLLYFFHSWSRMLVHGKLLGL